MAPPPEEEKPLPRPEPEPKPPKVPEPPKPKPAGPLPERDGDGDPAVVVATTSPPADLFCADTCSGACAYLPHCQPSPPPSSRGTTLHLRSSRLPTPLIALSASLLAVSAVLLLVLLIHRLVAQRRRRRRARDAALALAHHGEEGGGGHQVLAGAVAQEVGEEEAGGGGGVHHVWYIRTKGLDERDIAAIAAVVYDAKQRRGGGGGGTNGDDGDGDDGSCAVCLAEFRDGETLRLLPRCGHAFHRGCIDTWLRAHVNCPLCRAPVQVALAASANNPSAAPGAPAATPGARQERNLVGAVGGVQATEETARGGGVPDRAVRRAASMVALPRRAWPDVSMRAPASSSGREEDMTGLGKISRLLKFSDALEMAGIGVERSVSFGAGSCQRLPPRSGPSVAAGVSADETSQ
ncbi:E3 ubiquitin-protein ligase EL5-like [Miscanthus floridulus]|uniref:E3 ubiquitin-protein ligase EL5-like n=1 Tax=Miscanthus floridulus TaxID=154761 RepID=UPI00345ADDA9